MIKNIILQGDALQKLKELPSESINCVMTSPPYWSLRDYSTEGIIWDGLKDCEHDFVVKERYIHRGSTDVENSIHGAIKNENLKVDWKTQDGFCNFCKAWKGQLGLEPTFDLYISHLCNIFDEVKRVLRKDGTCWINLGDTYSSGNRGENINDGFNQHNASLPPNRLNCGIEDKSLCMIPFRFAIEMVNRDWILRNTIIWHKPNCMPSSVKDRFTVNFEYLFFFVKSRKYYFETQYENLAESSFNDKRKDKGLVAHKTGKSQDIKLIQNRSAEQKLTKQDLVGNPQYTGFNSRYKKSQYAMNGTSINSQGRNKRTVWRITTKPFKESHFAVYPEELCETPIKAGCPEGGICLDPFFGAGTTGLVALKQGKNFIGIELNPEYIKIAEKRLKPFLEQRSLL